jgi:hypothetical protein
MNDVSRMSPVAVKKLLFEELKKEKKKLHKSYIVRPNISFLISNFRRVLNAVCFLLGNSPASEFYMPTFRNTLFHLHRRVGVKNG